MDSIGASPTLSSNAAAAAANSDNKSIDLLLSDSDNDTESPTSKAKKSLNKTRSSIGPMCIVDEKIFKVPSTYRCTNYYLPPDIDSSLLDVNELNRTRGRGDAYQAKSPVRAAQYHYLNQPVDDDDILLQLAIQQSLAGDSNANESSTDTDTEAQMTALEMLGHRNLNRSGATQSLQQYNERQANRTFKQNDEDLLLQR
jgi:hypothetical protein